MYFYFADYTAAGVSGVTTGVSSTAGVGVVSGATSGVTGVTIVSSFIYF